MITGCNGPFSYTVAGVPSYCQLGGNRCGAACAQMIIQFCCEKVSPAFVPSWYGSTIANQQYICHESGGVWSGRMKDYHDANGIGSPYKHPDAVKQVIMDHKETAPGNYVVFHNTDPAVVMHDMLYWIKKIDYPSATMKGGTHWVLVYGYETNVEPTTSNTVTLEHISIIEPACYPCSDPANGGLDIPDITGTAWYANYWHQGVQFWAGEAYHGEYVAVVEPPATKGRVKFEKEYIGKKEEIIPVESIMKKAMGYIKARELTEYRTLKFMAQATPQTPLLVEWQGRKKVYYLVPFTMEKGKPAKAVMIINAYNGNYQECGALCCPFAFVLEKEAINLLLEKTGIKKYEKLIASLKFVDSDITRSHYYPFWEINIDGKVFYVDQNREIHKELRIPK
jgi:hypothetical protein